MADTASLMVRVQATGAEQAAKQLDNLSSSAGKADSSTKKLTDTTSAATPKMNAMRASIGNAGYQVQDFIVQIQGGQSALTAFTQQGSQLVSAFNPIAGTVLTIATVIGGALYASLSNSTDTAKQLEEATKFLDDALNEATPGVYDMNDALEKLDAVGATTAEKMAFLNKALEATAIQANSTADKIVEAIDKVTKAQSLFQKLTTNLAASQIAQGGDAAGAVAFQYESAAEAAGLTAKELRSIEVAQKAIAAGVPGAREGLVAYLDGINAKTPEAQMEINKLRNELNYLGVEEKTRAAERKGVEQSEKTYEKDKADRAQKEIDRQNRIAAAAKKRADAQARADARAQESAQKAADQFIAQIDTNTGTELERIDAKEKQKLAKLQEFHDKQLVSDADYEKSKSDIMAEFQAQRDALYNNADAYLEKLQALGGTEFEEIQRQNDAKLKQLDDFLKQKLISEEEYANAVRNLNEQSNIAQANATADAFGSMAADAKSALGETSAAYKAFAITQATIATYTAAIEAYKSTAAIPIVGPALAPVAAGLAVAAGVANIAKISGAREQGGQMNAGGSYLVGERGPEIIKMAGSGRATNASQTRQQLNGNNSGNSGPSNVTIVNNTSSQIGNVSTEQDDEGRLRIIIEEQVAASLQNSNSKISKARKATRNAPGFK
ncbi:TPA: hypothetical protein P1E36_002450 [Escherichia coli]|nr:MAG: hypothetical protein [Bacteriophage sp.]UVM95097.1 MAG: hypothetical protein [Bacteriophage sp.]HDN1095990.1 hypothetical protein [Escherichia coli]